MFLPGDVNGDGFGDVIIGALRISERYSGQVNIIFGGPKNGHLFASDLKSNVSLGYVIYGEPWSWFGYSVSGAGELSVLTLQTKQ